MVCGEQILDYCTLNARVLLLYCNIEVMLAQSKFHHADELAPVDLVHKQEVDLMALT